MRPGSRALSPRDPGSSYVLCEPQDFERLSAGQGFHAPALQREIVREFTTDLQRVGELVYQIGTSGNPKAMEDNSTYARKLEDASQQPKSTLEMYRFVSGYFRARS